MSQHWRSGIAAVVLLVLHGFCAPVTTWAGCNHPVVIPLTDTTQLASLVDPMLDDLAGGPQPGPAVRVPSSGLVHGATLSFRRSRPARAIGGLIPGPGMRGNRLCSLHRFPSCPPDLRSPTVSSAALAFSTRPACSRPSELNHRALAASRLSCRLGFAPAVCCGVLNRTRRALHRLDRIMMVARTRSSRCHCSLEFRAPSTQTGLGVVRAIEAA